MAEESDDDDHKCPDRAARRARDGVARLPAIANRHAGFAEGRRVGCRGEEDCRPRVGGSRHLLLYPGATAEFADRSRRGTDQSLRQPLFHRRRGHTRLRACHLGRARPDRFGLSEQGRVGPSSRHEETGNWIRRRSSTSSSATLTRTILAGRRISRSRTGAKVVLGAADWEALDQAAASPQPNAAKPPKRDIAAKDGQTIRVGDAQITIVHLPGHTPGGVGFVFPVKDGKETRMAAMNAATILLLDNPRLSVATMQQYAEAIQNFKSVTTRMKVEVEVQNHPLFDNTFEKASRLSTRKPGDSESFRRR